MNKWISVDNDLPNAYQRVLCYADGEIWVSYVSDPSLIGLARKKKYLIWHDESCCIQGTYIPTHWMPLPDAPTKEKEREIRSIDVRNIRSTEKE